VIVLRFSFYIAAILHRNNPTNITSITYLRKMSNELKRGILDLKRSVEQKGIEGSEAVQNQIVLNTISLAAKEKEIDVERQARMNIEAVLLKER
jgi:hypothetical protein